MEKALFWFRRDLRLNDSYGLFKALTSGFSIVPVFVFDAEILNRLPDRSDRRVQFIHDHVAMLQSQLRSIGSELVVNRLGCVTGFCLLQSNVRYGDLKLLKSMARLGLLV